MKDASGEKRYTYDDADRLTKILQGPQGFVDGTDQNYKLEYTWNAASQKTETKLTIRTLSTKTWTYAFTDDGQLDTEVNPDSETTDHDYLTDGRLKKFTLRKTGGGNGPTREYFYLDTNDSHAYVASKCKFLRKTLDKKSGGTTISSASYELDKGGRQLSDTDQDSKYKAYGLDPNSNTRAENMWATKTSATRDYQILAAFDGNGNRLMKFEDGVLTSYTYGDSNELTAAGSDSFTFDIFLNMATKVSGGNTTSYGWDKESNLLSIDFPSTANDDTHEYDGADRRMRSKLNGAANWTNFVWDEVEGTLLAEYTLISSTFTLISENTWGFGLISTNRGGTKRYFHFDGQGNTVALTDSSENITDTYGYTSSGVAVATQDSGTSTNPFRWLGQSGAYSGTAMGSSGGLLFKNSVAYSPTLGIRLNLVRGGRLYLAWFPGDYGNWCGAGRSGPGRPIDAIDACCMQHDNCLKNWWDLWKAPYCNCELCGCAKTAMAYCIGIGNWDCVSEALQVQTIFCAACPLLFIMPPTPLPTW